MIQLATDKASDLTGATPPVPAVTASDSYGQILKSSTLIGASQVAGVALGILRTKALAVLLGPAGLGVMGLYMSITNTLGALAGMGISTSGVREIAEAAGSNDQARVARTVKTLRTTALLLGAVGALLMVLFCRPLSRMTFGSADHAGAVALLAVAVLLASVTGGQLALIQGLRRIRHLASASLMGAVLGLVCSLPLVFWLGERGIVPYLLAVSFGAFIPSWWYARKFRPESASVDWPERWRIARGLLRLGVVFMISALLASATAYASRVIILDRLGLDAVGVYFAAWTLAGFYVRFILQAMAADFYPRLTAVANDRALCTQLVNEQAEIALLLATPGILATLALAPLIMHWFYSAQFAGGVEILRWQVLGVLLQVTSYPMGFTIMAQGRGRLFMACDIVNNVASLALLWLCVNTWGLAGAGISFLCQNVLLWVMDYAIARRLISFRWSKANVRASLVFAPLVVLVFLCQWVLPLAWAITAGVVAAIVAGIFSSRTLIEVLGPERVAQLKTKVKAQLGFSSQKKH